MDCVLGLDFGSVALAAATVDYDGRTTGRFYTPHGGDIGAALAKLDAELDTQGVRGVAITGVPLAEMEADARFEPQIAALESVKSRYPDAGAVLVVGGERYSLARFNDAGDQGREGKSFTQRTEPDYLGQHED